MPSLSTHRSDAEDASLGARLDCWKEIATYLGKVERTVKRWEADRGLPIHRVPGGGRASVYAFTCELDEWLKSSKALEGETAQGTNPGEAQGQEFSGDAFVLENPSGLANSLVHEVPALRSVLRGSWLLAFCGLLLLCLLGTGIYSTGIQTTEQRLSHALNGLFPDTHAKSVPTASIVVSDVEKRKARDLYLKGRYEWNQRTPDSLNRALDCFTQAIVHDPGYAKAYVGMADTYDLLREYSTMPDSEAYARAIAAATKAVELDDSLAEAHRALAFSEWWGKWDFVDGEKEFLRAIELNPKDPIARKWYANVLSVQGRFPESLEENEKAQELDRTSHSILADRGWMLFNSGRQKEGLALLKDVERSAPDFLSPHNYLMTVSLQRGDYPSYLAEGEKTADSENDPVLKGIIASARAGYDRDGGQGLLNGLYARQRAYYHAGKLPGTVLAKTCVLMGRKQEALQLLDEAYERHESSVLACKSESDLIILRDDPKFKALVKRINLPQGSQNARPIMLPTENQLSFRSSIDPH